MDTVLTSTAVKTGQTPALAWGRDRMGLIAIFASLAAIALMLSFLVRHLEQHREERIRAQGISLVRLLANMPLMQLAPGQDRQGVLQVIRQSHNDPDFAYAAVVDTGGHLLGSETAPGVLVPQAPLPDSPFAWLGERQIDLAEGRGGVQEFHAPLLHEGELVGHVRLGYYRDTWGGLREQLSFFATLALPIFLLGGLLYFLLRRETRPLRQISEGLNDLARQGSFHRVKVEAAGELGEFIRRFNAFMELSRERIHTLEAEHEGLKTSSRLLSYKRERVEAVLQSMPDALMVLDESGVVSFVNDRVGHLLGLEMEQILGHRARDWCPHPNITAFLSRYEDHHRAGYGDEGIEFAPPGLPDKFIAVNAYPLFSPHETHRVFGTLVVFRDISVEQAAKKNRAEFVAQVAHELKSPLNVLALYSESLQGEDGRDEAFRVEAVNVIRDEVERLSILINNLLSITKIEMGSMDLVRQRVKLRDLLEDAFKAVGRNARAQDVMLNLDLPPDISPINVDKELLRIAVNNLLTNAIKYNLPGGSITLSAEESDDSVCIRVRDTGIGISPADQARIFDKFYRSLDDRVRRRSGHGLGLSLARDIVQMHHGTLSVKSAPDEGAEFTIELDKDQVLLSRGAA